MTRRMQQEDFRIEPQLPAAPQIGALVQMIASARFTTVQAAAGLSVGELDAVPANCSNSSGMLLAHVAATDRLYQSLRFEGIHPMEPLRPVDAPSVGAMTFGEQGEKVSHRGQIRLSRKALAQ